MLNRVDSPKRKIVSNFEEAKKWTGIEKIIIEGDERYFKKLESESNNDISIGMENIFK